MNWLFNVENTTLPSDSSAFNTLAFLDINLKKCAEIRK